MKKTLLTLAATSFLVLAGMTASQPKVLSGIKNNTIVKKTATDALSMPVTKVESSSTLSGWGAPGSILISLAVIEPEVNTNGFGIVSSVSEVVNGIELYNSFGEKQEITTELIGQGITINRGKGLNYNNFILKVPTGSTFKAGAPFDGTNDFLDKTITITDTDLFYLCELNDGVGDAEWKKIQPPTSITLEKESLTLDMGSTITLAPVANGGTENLPFTFKSENETVAKVDKTGKITAIKEGATNILVHCGLVTKKIAVIVQGKTLTQTGIKVIEGKTQTITVGDNYDLSLIKVVKINEGDVEGEEIKIEQSMISGEFDNSKSGTYTLTITIGEFKDIFDVVVEDIPVVKIAGDQPGNHFGNGSGWGQFFFVTELPDIAQYLNLQDIALNNAIDNILLNGQKAVKAVKNLGGGRYEIWFNDDIVLKAGDVITLNKGLKIYRYTGTTNGNHDAQGDGKFKAAGLLDKEYKYVFDGTGWHVYTGEPTQFEIENVSLLISVGQQEQIKYTVGPEGIYGTPKFVVENPEIVSVTYDGKVTGLKPGTTTVKATIGNIEKVVNITVEAEKDIKGIEFIGTPNYYSILLNSDGKEFKPTIEKARLIYVDDTKSGEFSITTEMYAIGEFSTATEGDIEIPVKITYRNKEYTSKLNAKVYSLYDQKPSEVAIVDWFNYGVFIQFPNSSTNGVNLTTEAELQQYHDMIHYQRADGSEVKLATVYELATNIAIFPEFLFDQNDNVIINETNYNSEGFYEKGDLITIDKMTPVYKWTGNKGAQDAPVPGTGELIIEGYVQETLQYKYNGQIWTTWIEYNDIKLEKTELTLEFGKTTTVPVTRDPVTATQGTFSYKSSNEKVVTVSPNGVIKAVGVGEATIEVTLSDEDYPDKTKKATLKVKVEDAIKEFEITNPAPFEVAKGTTTEQLTGMLTGQWKFASGKAGDAVDFSGAIIAGYEADKLGEQNITVTLKKDGKSYTTKLAITVIEPTPEGMPGWQIGAIVGGISGGVAIAGGAAAAIIIKKKKNK